MRPHVHVNVAAVATRSAAPLLCSPSTGLTGRHWRSSSLHCSLVLRKRLTACGIVVSVLGSEEASSSALTLWYLLSVNFSFLICKTLGQDTFHVLDSLQVLSGPILSSSLRNLTPLAHGSSFCPSGEPSRKLSVSVGWMLWRIKDGAFHINFNIRSLTLLHGLSEERGK